MMLRACPAVARFLLVDDVDPTGQLAWLAEELLQAEQMAEKVFRGQRR